MRKLSPSALLVLPFLIAFLLPKPVFSQSCSTLSSTYLTTESRCAATGAIQINATGGSGNYQYKLSGPMTTSYLSTSLITGLAPGNYLVTVKDVDSGCIYNKDSVTVPGNYTAPNFTMVSTGVTCMNGSNGTISLTNQTFGRAPFSYKIIAPSPSQVGNVSTTGNFTGLTSGTYLIQLNDSCGAIQTRSIDIPDYSWVIMSASVNKAGCDSADASIKLSDNLGNTNLSGTVFTGFQYGVSRIPGDTTWFNSGTFRFFRGNSRSVTLLAKDGCDNLVSLASINNAIPSVSSSVSISNKTCNGFTAKIKGKSNLTNPQYCLYDNSDNLISCNTSGTFNVTPYGSYCIKIMDVCYDTTITRCFNVSQPVPSVGASVGITYQSCSSFTASVSSLTNLTNPQFCIYDSSNVLITCNATGIFPGLSFGSYCIHLVNDPSCYDTTIVRCFTVARQVPSLCSSVNITNNACSTFSASIGCQSNAHIDQYCIYTSAGTLVACNTTGIFDSLAYGSYCIKAHNDAACYDTTITRCFTAIRPVPSLSSGVSTSNQNCTGFDVSIKNPNNLTNPQFCLYNSLNTLISCNATGKFTSIPYGSYCIKLQNDAACFDTLITRCFTVNGTPANINVSASKSCILIGGTDLKVNISSGTPSYSISLYNPGGGLIQTISTGSSSYTFTGIPNLTSGQKYKVVVTDQCGTKDSTNVTPVASSVTRSITLNPKCPSATWTAGSADVIINITENISGGTVVPKIVKKNGSTVSISASSSSGNTYNFLDIGPATYIFDTYVSTCSSHLYDTVIVSPYVYPNLAGSKAYQCDNGSFTVNVNAVNGIAPYTYEIFESIPASPNINAGPQASPVFTVSNGTSYSLVRLRAVDGCGNAGLYDASILPLAQTIVYPTSSDCYNQSFTLFVDSIPNAVNTWYKRIVPNDSIAVGYSSVYSISNLTSADTGRYFVKTVINSGCIVKYANYIITGYCGSVLALQTELSGTKQNTSNKLIWYGSDVNIAEYSLQRAVGSAVSFETINTSGYLQPGSHSFIDKTPGNGNNFYRLKLTTLDGKIRYTNTVLLRNMKYGITFYPNPVSNELYISFSNAAPRNYSIEFRNLWGQTLLSKKIYNIQVGAISYPRVSSMIPGIYTVTITDLDTGEQHSNKVIYK